MRRRSRQPRPPRLTHAKGWFSAFLILLLLFYIVIIWNLERIDLTQWAADFSAAMLTPTGPYLFFELIFRVLRHLIPVAVGWWFAYQAGVETIERLYGLADKDAAKRFTSRLRSPMSRNSGTHGLNRQTLEKERETSVILGVGGPGKVLVAANEVAVTEINGRKARILPPGKQLLSPYEYIHTVIDLRPQERVERDAALRTKDNIDVEATFSIVYRIKPGDEEPTKNRPYPYDDDAVWAAAYAQTVLGNGIVATWEGKPIGTTRSKLGAAVAKFELDELMHPSGGGDEPYRALQQQVWRTASVDLARSGVELLSVSIHHIKPPKAVEAQYIAYWQSQWESKAKISKAVGEATAVEEIEVAKAEAEVAMIQAILEGIQRARRSGATTRTSEIVALRLVEGLERMAEQKNQTQPLMPMLSQLQTELQANDPLEIPEEAEGNEPT